MHTSLCLYVLSILSGALKNLSLWSKSIVMLLLLVAVLCMTSTISLATDVKVLPLGVTREFVCSSPPETDYAVIGWAVNGSSVVSSQFQDYIVLGEEVHSESGELQRSLTFIADARANNTHILCTTTYFDNGGFNTLVLVDMDLVLQGHVSPPAVTYEMSSDHHSVMFSWSAPFTLNISDMEPDILHYVVYIISDDGHNDTVTTTDTHYELQADPCQSHQYHVEIAAVNVVGEGEKYRSPEIILEEYAQAVVSDTTVSFRNRMVVIQMTVEVSPHCHEVEVVNYEVELNATYSTDRLLFKSSGDISKHTVNITSPIVTMNELYDYSVRIEGLPNSESTRMDLRTFDIQSVNTTIRDQYSGYVDITCHFAKGSDAEGCRIVLHTQNFATFCEFVATREDRDESTVTVVLPNGTYTLLVYDDEDEGDNNPAFTTTLTVHSSAQVSECVSGPSDCKSQSTSLNYVLLSAAAAGGLVSSVVISLICLTVSTVLIRRERKKAAIVMTPNIAYEEVKMKKKRRHTIPNHAQPVLTTNQDQ